MRCAVHPAAHRKNGGLQQKPPAEAGGREKGKEPGIYCWSTQVLIDITSVKLSLHM